VIRLRVSDLDQWLAYVEPEREQFELSTDELLARLTDTREPTPDMLAGSAFHALLEHANEGDEWGPMEGVERDGFRFRFDIDHDLALPAEREPAIIEHTVDTPSGKVLLRGRIDGRDAGGTVVDYKLTGRFDAERYGRSLQWRAYLLMTGARRFRYLAFENRRKDTDVWIYGVHPLDFWPYPEMARDVHQRVCELAEFVVRHVPERVKAA
jgi:hypothetical protein